MSLYFRSPRKHYETLGQCRSVDHLVRGRESTAGGRYEARESEDDRDAAQQRCARKDTASGHDCKRVRKIARLGAGLWNAEVLADLRRQKVVDLAMTRYCGHLSLGPVHVDGVRTAFPEELAAVTFEMTREVSALHAER
jgi:hypothetical protein